jgi:hypothetical protein
VNRIQTLDFAYRPFRHPTGSCAKILKDSGDRPQNIEEGETKLTARKDENRNPELGGQIKMMNGICIKGQ